LPATINIRAKRYWSHCGQVLLLVLTHNIAIILRFAELFYRAYLTPLNPHVPLSP